MTTCARQRRQALFNRIKVSKISFEYSADTRRGLKPHG
jgi:hypothetical protein